MGEEVALRCLRSVWPCEGLSNRYAKDAENGQPRDGDESTEAAVEALRNAEAYLDQGDGQNAVLEGTLAVALWKAVPDHIAAADAYRISMRACLLQEDIAGAKELGQEALSPPTEEAGDMVTSQPQEALAKLKLSMAEVHLSDEELELAHDEASEARRLFEDLRQERMVALALLRLSKIELASTGKLESLVSAARHIDLAIATFREVTGCELDIAYALCLQSDVLWQQQCRREAKELLEQAIDMTRPGVAANSKHAAAHAIFSLTLAARCADGREYLEALQAAEEAMKSFLELATPQDDWLLACIHVICKIHVRRQEPPRALKVSIEWLRKFRDQQNVKGQVRILLTMVHAHLAQADAEAAVQVATEACSLARSTTSAQLKAQALHQLTMLHLGLASPSQALPVAEEALQVTESLHHWRDKVPALEAIIEVHSRLCDRPQAALNAKHLLQVVTTNGTRGEKASAMLRLAMVGVALEEQEALEMAETAQELFAMDVDLNGEAQAVLVIARLHLQREDLEECLAAANKAAGVFKELGNLEGEVFARVLAVEAMYLDYVMNPLPSQPFMGFDTRWHHLTDSALVAELLARRLDNDAVLGSVLLLIARASEFKGLNDDALKAASEAAEMFEEVADFAGEAASHLLCSRVHGSERSMTLAEESAQRAAELYEMLGDREGVASTMQILDGLGMKDDRSSVVEGTPQSRRSLQVGGSRLLPGVIVPASAAAR